MDETDEKERDPAVVTQVMRAAAKAKAASFRGKFSKYAAVANPKLGDRFLEEVSLEVLILSLQLDLRCWLFSMTFIFMIR